MPLILHVTSLPDVDNTTLLFFSPTEVQATGRSHFGMVESKKKKKEGQGVVQTGFTKSKHRKNSR